VGDTIFYGERETKITDFESFQAVLSHPSGKDALQRE
jgi:hypothetical protein